MCELKIDGYAQFQKESILEYITNNLDNPIAAQRLDRAFNKGFSRIRHMPYSCPVCQFSKPKKQEYRRLNVNNYLALYWIDESKNLITVARIFHGSQDYENKF
jgi:plasmid stabilization system protein ParE